MWAGAIVVMTDEDLEKLDYTKPIVLFSQTTKSTENFYHIKSYIEERAKAVGNYSVTANDTICRQVSNRAPNLEKFAARFDVIVFVSGKKSSNGKVLHGVCQSVNPKSYFVSGADELKAEWFDGAQTVGIAGATSTPMWLIQEVANKIETLTDTVSA